MKTSSRIDCLLQTEPPDRNRGEIDERLFNQ